VLSYRAYSDREPRSLYTSAIALELLHAFILIHDDLADRSATRRNGPALHVLLQRAMGNGPAAGFSADSVPMIAGDMLYALGIEMFMSVDEAADRKIAAMRHLTRAALHTACGEIREFFHTLTPLDRITPEVINETCRLKTACYSFTCPMVTGAILAGADSQDIETIRKCSPSIGLAYQIRDDQEL
jgi:geranylgeranyl diphosphate synthase, type I